MVLICLVVYALTILSVIALIATAVSNDVIGRGTQLTLWAVMVVILGSLSFYLIRYTNYAFWGG